MFVFDFGRADDGRDIAREITSRMGPSLAIAVPTFILGLFVAISFALLLVFFRATALDFCRRGAVRGDDVDLRPVLHHRRPVAGVQGLAPGADLGLWRRARCRQAS
jgi:hypothetical protein